MPSLPAILCAASLGLIACYALCVAARDLAVLFLRFVGHLPAGPVYAAARSGKWPALEHDWLKVHGSCAACGGKEQLSVHHKRPFHLHPDLELDERNLITLCEKHCCHLMIGHNGDFHAYNPHVEKDAAVIFDRVQHRRYA